MKKRRTSAKPRSTGTADEWERGWDIAMTRIDGVPAQVKRQPLFRDCLMVLNGAFADGNRLLFELGLSFLIDFCNEAVSKGDCEAWWN